MLRLVKPAPTFAFLKRFPSKETKRLFSFMATSSTRATSAGLVNPVGPCVWACGRGVGWVVRVGGWGRGGWAGCWGCAWLGVRWVCVGCAWVVSGFCPGGGRWHALAKMPALLTSPCAWSTARWPVGRALGVRGAMACKEEVCQEPSPCACARACAATLGHGRGGQG